MLIRDIKKRIDEGTSLELITQSFTEIASVKLRKIRKGIEQNRTFFYELSNIYSLINIISTKAGIQKEFKINKTAVVLIGSNERFYGSITNDLLEYFVNIIKNKDVDRFIIGKTGHNYFESIQDRVSFKKITLKKDIPTREELQSITGQIKDYKKVLVFYSQFKSVLVQKATFKDISQSVSDINYSGGSSELVQMLKGIDYIVEPEIHLMLQFFDTQIKSLILEALFLESELARTASRLIAMDNAQNEAKNYITQWRKTLGSAKKSIINARVLESVQVAKALRLKLKVNNL